MKRELSELDHDLLKAFGCGDIALVRSTWLLAQLALQPDYRIVRRQDLKPVGGISPHLEPEEAKRLLLKGERAIGAFSFGWPTSRATGTQPAIASKPCGVRFESGPTSRLFSGISRRCTRTATGARAPRSRNAPSKEAWA